MSKTLYRAVGFTGSWYQSGGREIGWKGDFFLTREEAEDAGCGVGDGWHHGEETREYTITDDGDLLVDGEPGRDSLIPEIEQEYDRLTSELASR